MPSFHIHYVIQFYNDSVRFDSLSELGLVKGVKFESQCAKQALGMSEFSFTVYSIHAIQSVVQRPVHGQHQKHLKNAV